MGSCGKTLLTRVDLEYSSLKSLSILSHFNKKCYHHAITFYAYKRTCMDTIKQHAVVDLMRNLRNRIHCLECRLLWLRPDPSRLYCTFRMYRICHTYFHFFYYFFWHASNKCGHVNNMTLAFTVLILYMFVKYELIVLCENRFYFTMSMVTLLYELPLSEMQ